MKIAPVILEEFNSNWADLFNAEKEVIEKAIGSHIISIEHIGSTAVEGSIAKPEIDILIGVKTLGDAEKCISFLADIGYAYYQRFEEFVPERRYFRKSEGITPLVHIHMVEKDSNFYRDHMLLTEYLQNNPETVKEYNEIKEKLVTEFDHDRKSYSKAKEQFILDLLKRIKGN
jgi:GrpB-like predicted nucleotidyltransferase (UPF0157 family)